jgi:hypothetical protein
MSFPIYLREVIFLESTKYECDNGKEQVLCPEQSLNSIQLGETNGFLAVARFPVLNEIIIAIRKLTAILLFIVLSDSCDFPDLVCVMVHCLLYHVSWVAFTVEGFAAK